MYFEWMAWLERSSQDITTKVLPIYFNSGDYLYLHHLQPNHLIPTWPPPIQRSGEDPFKANKNKLQLKKCLYKDHTLSFQKFNKLVYSALHIPTVFLHISLLLDTLPI